MFPAEAHSVLKYLIVVGVLFTLVGTAGIPSANASKHYVIIADGVVSGSGTAGTGSFASGTIFDNSNSDGRIGFSGILVKDGITTDAAAIGALRTLVTASPILPCGSAPEIAISGVVILGRFEGQQVLAYGCVGTNLPVGLDVYTYDAAGQRVVTFSGKGNGTVTVSNGSLAGSLTVATAVPGSGTAGSGTLHVAEASGITSTSQVVGGGAFVGNLDLAGAVSGVYDRKNVSVIFSSDTCTLIGSGSVTAGSFLAQPVVNSLHLSTCPPSSAPQTTIYTILVGFNDSPIFKGHTLGTLKAVGATWIDA